VTRFLRSSWLRARLADDRGSLPMAMLVSLVGVLLSALLVPVLLDQAQTTTFDSTRVQSLGAAQAGIDLTLGQIRSAKDSTGTGDTARLPCGPLTGSVDSASNATYSVTIKYFPFGVDPVANPSATPMLCVAGYGTYNPDTGDFTPGWARLTSTGRAAGGKGASTGRTLITTYKFQTNSTYTPGGVIRIFPASATSNAMCLDAGSTVPAAGTLVALQNCSNSTPPAAQQVFVYRTDLTLQLLSSVTTTNVNGMCLSYTGASAGIAVKFATCSALGNAPWTQQWSFDDNGAFRASLANSANDGNLSGVCMNVSAQTSGTNPTLQSCSGGTSSPTQAWIPSPSVGAGAAKSPQWVNFYEFGRCLDVTNQNVNSTYLIDYPCKQNPYPNAVAWNQKFTGPVVAAGASSASGRIYTTTGSTQYCLTSPGTDGGLVTMKVCGTTGALQTWTVYNNDDSLAYAQKFTVVDSRGLCLALTTPQNNETWSAIDVERCVGAADQKWNADPTTPSVLNTRER
jgi:hypothetical protein